METIKNALPATIAILLTEGAAKIKKSLPNCVTASLDASLLLAHVLAKSREELILNRRECVAAEFTERYFALIKRRCLGEPVAYLIEKKSFWLYDFYVTPDVLIPKPDTELLVEKALEIIEEKLRHSFQQVQVFDDLQCETETYIEKQLAIADICTGSGCVAISLLAHFNEKPKREQAVLVIATDISEAALNIARKNAQSILSTKTRSCLNFVRSDLLDFVQEETGSKPTVECRFDLIVSNPPYVPLLVAKELLADGRGEPLLALDGGVDGLDLLRRLVPQSYIALKLGGVLLVESGEYNAAATRELFLAAGFCGVQTFTDLAGMPRVTGGKKPLGTTEGEAEDGGIASVWSGGKAFPFKS